MPMNTVSLPETNFPKPSTHRIFGALEMSEVIEKNEFSTD